MQQSTDPHYFEMANYPDKVYQQMENPKMNPIVPQANLPTQINPQNESDPTNQAQTRQAFLIKYYIKQILQLLGITLIYGINQIDSFSSIYLSEVDREWWGSSYTYEQFRGQLFDGPTYKEYIDWMEEKRREYMEYKFTWVYYMILALTLFFILFVPFARNYRSFVQKQSIFLLIQTVLFGFVLGGLSSGYKKNWQYDGTVLYILLALQGLILNAILNLVLIKINKIQVYGKLSNGFTYFFFGFNLLMGFREYYMVEGLPIVEFIALYFFFYFDQLNKSLLIEPSELPPTINIVDMLRNIQTEQKQNEFQSNQNFVMINKKILTIVAIVLGLILVEVIGYLANTLGFIIISVLSALTMLSFAVPTQVAQQNLEIEDVNIAVMMTYLDILCPIQNLIRRIKK